MITSEDLYTEQFEENDLETFEDGNEADTNVAEEIPAEADESSNKDSVKPKRVVRNPQPKLNEETLKGKRGLTALESYFDRIKYKGRGHEEEDLTMILKTYEYWCHRLFPKYSFDDCVKKIENLGYKKPVKTHIKKIRLDMVYDDDPIINDDLDPEENLNNQFDHVFEAHDVPMLDDDYELNRTDTNTETPIEITEEQLERIRLNKERAKKLRKEKLENVTKSNELQNNSQLSCELTINTQNSISTLDDGQEDVNSIFDKIQDFNAQTEQSNIHENINSCPIDVRVNIPENELRNSSPFQSEEVLNVAEDMDYIENQSSVKI